MSNQIHEISSVRQALADLDDTYKRQRSDWENEVARLRAELSSTLNAPPGVSVGLGGGGPHATADDRYGGGRDGYGGGGGGGRRGPAGDGDVDMHDPQQRDMRERDRDRDRDRERDRERDRDRDIRRKDKIPKSERTSYE